MISLSQTRYGSGRRAGGARHGRARRCRSYHWSSSAGSGSGPGIEAVERVAVMSDGRRDRDDGRLAAASGQGEHGPNLRHGGLRAVGAAAARIAAPVVARHGGGVLGRLKAEWSAVAGAELAAATWPEELGRDGALKLRVAPRAALELQHRAPLLIERINLYFGRAAVVRLVLRQGPLPLAGPPARAPAPSLAAGDAQALDATLADISDPELRAALGGLGRLVLARARQGT